MSPRTIGDSRGAHRRRLPEKRPFRLLSFGEAVGFCAETYVEPLPLVAAHEHEDHLLDEPAVGLGNPATAASSPSLYERISNLLSLHKRVDPTEAPRQGCE